MVEWHPLTLREIPDFVDCLLKYPLSMDDTIKEFPLQFYAVRIQMENALYVKVPGLGYMALDPIGPHDAVIHFIRDPSCRAKKRIYLDMAKTFMVWAFNYYLLHRITLTVVEGATGPFMIAKLLGFTHEGTLRQCRIINDQLYDVHIFGLLTSEV